MAADRSGTTVSAVLPIDAAALTAALDPRMLVSGAARATHLAPPRSAARWGNGFEQTSRHSSSCAPAAASSASWHLVGLVPGANDRACLRRRRRNKVTHRFTN